MYNIRMRQRYKDRCIYLSKIFLAMKLTIVFVLIATLNAMSTGLAQTVSLRLRNTSLEEAFSSIRKQTGYRFIYQAEVLKNTEKVNVELSNVPLKTALDKLVENKPLTYQLHDGTIVIKAAQKHIEKSTSDILQQVFSGTITDRLGEKLSGVTIRNQRTGNSAVSRENGYFELTNVQLNDELVFSLIGHKSYKLRVVDYKVQNIVLLQEDQGLDEVVVVGYGSVAKEELTGSVAQVNMSEVTKAPVASFMEALAGRVAGVQVSAMDGQPGEELNIVIRGAGSLTQNTEPLYVIDGFPMEEFLASSLNPEEIESINMLKDASATAIYGARASNGVVMIQTKKGKEGRPVVTLNSSLGYQEVGNRMEMMSPYEFVKYHAERNPTVTQGRYFQNGRTLETYRDMAGIDWQGQLFQRKPTIINNLAIRGGTANTKYSISGSTYNQEGVVLNTGFKRYQGRVSVDQVISNKLDVGINVNKSLLDAYGVQAATGSESNPTNFLFYNAWGYRPISGRDDLDLEDEDFDPDNITTSEERMNPIVTAENTNRNYATDAFSAVAFINYEIIKGLKWRTTGNYSNRKFVGDVFYNSRTPQGNPHNQNNRRGINGSVRYDERSTWSSESTLTYDKQFKRGNRLNAMAGFSAVSMDQRIFGVAVQNIPNEELDLSGFDEGTPYSSPASITNYTLASFFGRLRYSFRYSKYVVEAVFRSDGSSKFAPGNKWGFFPSGSFAWNMKRESFLKDFAPITVSKLRVSYGHTGNNRVSNFAYLSSLSFPLTNSYSFNNAYPTKGMIPNDLGNYDLRWENTEQIDIGYDVGLWKDRVKFTVDLYQRNARNLLLDAKLPLTTGFESAFRNIGRLRNRGLEMSLNVQHIQTKDFQWSSSVNISFNDNRVVELTDNQTNLFSYTKFVNQYDSSPLYVAQIGQPAAMFYGYIFDGVYQYTDFDSPAPDVYTLKSHIPDNGDPNVQPGDIKYRDLNGDGTVNGFDQTIIGRGMPVHVGGFNNNLTYKGFDLNVFFQWSYGNDIFNANRLFLEGNGLLRTDLNQFASYIDRWSPENPTNSNYRANGQGPLGRFSSRTVEDGSYLRLKTVSLGYELPKHIVNRARISRLRLNLSAQNVLTWTKYSGMDPEVSVRNSILTPGFDYSAYPAARTLVFGLNATF